MKIKAALEAVASGSVHRPARDHGAHSTTLKDRLAGRVQHGDKPGPKPYLDQRREMELGHFCNSAPQTDMGNPKRFIAIAQSNASSKAICTKIEDQPGMGPSFFLTKRGWHV